MKSTDLRAKARAIFGSAVAEPMPKQPNGAKALQQRANARPIPTYKVGGVVKKADGGKAPMRLTAAEKKMGDALMMTRKGKEVMNAQKRMESDKDMMRRKKQEAADRLLGIPKKKDGGKLSEFEKAFAGARKEGKKTFDYSGKSYTTEMRGEKKKDFGDAFAAARKAGKSTFDFGGKSYTTKTREEQTTPAPKPAAAAPAKPAAAAAPAAAPAPKKKTLKERFQTGTLFKAKDGGKAGCYAEGGKPLKFDPKKEKPFKFEPKKEKPFKFEPKPEKPFKFTGKKDGGKVQTSADTAKKLATEMGGMKKGGKAKDGLAVMIAIGKVKKPVKKAAGGTGRANMRSEPAAKNTRGLMLRKPQVERILKPDAMPTPPTPPEPTRMPTPPTPPPPPPPPPTRVVYDTFNPSNPTGYKKGGSPVKKAVGGAGKTRKGMAPIKKAQGGAAKVRKGMMSETGDIKQVVKPKRGIGGM